MQSSILGQGTKSLHALGQLSQHSNSKVSESAFTAACAPQLQKVLHCSKRCLGATTKTQYSQDSEKRQRQKAFNNKCEICMHQVEQYPPKLIFFPGPQNVVLIWK